MRDSCFEIGHPAICSATLRLLTASGPIPLQKHLHRLLHLSLDVADRALPVVEVEVSGFENLSGITSAAQMFASCPALETIYATSFSSTGLSGSLMFNGCNRLVGGADSFVPSSTSGASVCKLGAGGVLTDPNNDGRCWFYAHYYDGEGMLAASSSPESGARWFRRAHMRGSQVRGARLYAMGRRHRADPLAAPYEREIRFGHDGLLVPELPIPVL